MGGGAGFGFYSLRSPVIYANRYTSGVGSFQAGLSTLELGFSATGLAGIRLHFTDKLGMFLEGRYTTALINYSRDIQGETDEAAFRGYMLCAGFAVKW